MKSLRIKFIAIISLIIILILSISGYIIITQKKRELSYDIYLKARSFAELTVSEIIDNYNIYYKSQSFIHFNRKIQNIFALNPDIERIQIANYNSEILYDSIDDISSNKSIKKIVNDEMVIRLKDIKPSIKTENRIVYLIKNTSDGSYKYTNKEEINIETIQNTEKIDNIVYPYTDNQTRVIYYVSYDNLLERIYETTFKIALILFISFVIGVIISFIFADKIIKPINKLTKGLNEIAKGNLKYRVKVRVKDEIKTLADGFNKMAEDLSISTKAMIEKEKISKELEIAKKIQDNLLPPLPKIPGLHIAASVKPAEEVGGDCYDFIEASEDNTMFYLADVTGHGVPAGLIVAITNALFYTMLKFYKNTRDIIIQINNILKEKTESNMFVTAVLCDWNHKNKTLKYTSAGHEQIIHFQSNQKKSVLCPAGGMALGMFPKISKYVKEEKILLNNDDVIIIYSDGIPEAWSSDTEMLGMKKFQKIVDSICNKYSDPKDIHDQIIKQVKQFMGKYPQADDITLIVAKHVL